MGKVSRGKGKPNKWMLASVLILMLLVLGLAYFFDIYPGSMVFTEETPNQMTITKQRFWVKDSITVDVMSANQVRASLMKLLGEELEFKWYLIVLTFFIVIFSICNLVVNHQSIQKKSNEIVVMLYVYTGVLCSYVLCRSFIRATK
ncbi:hypothetical protein NCCP2222_23610 [Sporosarcina sp. NCCP-2222]|uniref:hypothetical protein n=1 Tax=Sporosarcina sp. NCCP-2222 TaxID=2935073 RepID=UPI002086A31E|nr:hypothetical protein [Sporosarcina sp. NCCP-2222]GKV56414.1 hypothetical protein NCCP2222_23610 [Sporosarcina sp. NCCP-2222]